jgi:hypothetical protein
MTRTFPTRRPRLRGSSGNESSRGVLFIGEGYFSDVRSNGEPGDKERRPAIFSRPMAIVGLKVFEVLIPGSCGFGWCFCWRQIGQMLRKVRGIQKKWHHHILLASPSKTCRAASVATHTGDKRTNTWWVHAEHIEITVNK